jgi:hypothetical protein
MADDHRPLAAGHASSCSRNGSFFVQTHKCGSPVDVLTDAPYPSADPVARFIRNYGSDDLGCNVQLGDRCIWDPKPGEQHPCAGNRRRRRAPMHPSGGPNACRNPYQTRWQPV